MRRNRDLRLNSKACSAWYSLESHDSLTELLAEDKTLAVEVNHRHVNDSEKLIVIELFFEGLTTSLTVGR